MSQLQGDADTVITLRPINKLTNESQVCVEAWATKQRGQVKYKRSITFDLTGLGMSMGDAVLCSQTIPEFSDDERMYELNEKLDRIVLEIERIISAQNTPISNSQIYDRIKCRKEDFYMAVSKFRIKHGLKKDDDLKIGNKKAQ